MLEQFRQEGYEIVNGVVDIGTLRTIRLFLEESAQEARDMIAGPASPERAKVIAGHLPLHRRLDRTLWAVTLCSGLRDLLKELFPGKVGMHLPPAARYVVPGNKEALVPAHQDAAYNGHMSDFVTVWIPFTEIDAESGGVEVYRGTNRLPPIGHGPRGTVWFDGIALNDAKAEHCIVPLGGALLLSPTIIHASLPNTSSRTRYSIDYRFFTGGSTKHYLDLETMKVVEPP